MDNGQAARRGAIRALDWVLRERRMLAHLRPDDRMSAADRARAQRLTLMVLRHVGPLDALLKGFLDRKPRAAAKMALRLGAAEILIAGSEPYGVIDSIVGLLKAQRNTARFGGFANAVLRRVADDGPSKWAEMPPQRLPGWLGGELNKRFGFDAVRAIERAHAAGAPLDLTLKGADVDIPGASILPTGSLRLAAGAQVSGLPGYDDGAWWVQDAAAALPARLLGDVAGATVLDLCAAPGGKTMQLAAAGAKVTALDLSETRMARLKDNLDRTGLSATCVVEDAFAHTGQYDAILLDAPCSATGTIRRHPDLPFVKSPQEVEALTKLQMRMIDHAIGLLRPGGRLVYCTCSLLPTEGEFQVKAALKRHDGLTVLPRDPADFGGDAQWHSAEGGWRLRPDYWAERGGMDGFYMAAMQVA